MGETADSAVDGPVPEIVLFGASGGIGQSLVKAFRGTHRVIGTHSGGDSSGGDSSHLADGAEYHAVDVTDRARVRSFLGDLMPQLERPVMVYAVGVSPNGLTHKVDDDAWDDAISVNLTGAMAACRGVLPRMREVGYGRIVLVSSVLARIAVPGTAGYSAAKAGLCALARVIAVENAKKGITANALALGYYDVGIIREVPDAYLKEHVLPSIPRGELGSADNIVSAIRFILEADYLTGSTLDINGGIVGT